MNLSPLIEVGHLEVTICTNSEYDCCNVELLNSNTFGFDAIDKNNALKGVNLGECYLFELPQLAILRMHYWEQTSSAQYSDLAYLGYKK